MPWAEFERNAENEFKSVAEGAIIYNNEIAKASRNYMSSRDKFKQNMEAVPPLNGYQDIACHADPFLFSYEDPDTDETYETLNASKFYNRLVKDNVLTDDPIRLFSCESGKYPGGLAQQFANVSGKKVLAPIGTVYNDEKGYVAVANDDAEAAVKFAEAYKKKQKWSMDGWKEFFPKE